MMSMGIMKMKMETSSDETLKRVLAKIAARRHRETFEKLGVLTSRFVESNALEWAALRFAKMAR